MIASVLDILAYLLDGEVTDLFELLYSSIRQSIVDILLDAVLARDAQRGGAYFGGGDAFLELNGDGAVMIQSIDTNED